MNHVIYTIDVEGHRGKKPFEHLVWGKCADGSLHGIDQIMDIADTYNIRGLFFVDFAAAWDYGEDTVRDVVLHILERGHNVGVHIHPHHMADVNREFLWEYNYEEQKEIISKCTELYRQIVGKYPISFRAGKYGANRQTLDILSELGYKFDFSQYYGQKWCAITPPVAYNIPQKYNDTLSEIPVTAFCSFRVGKKKRYDRLDAATFSLTFQYVMSKISTIQKPILVTMFSHSFSFLKWRDNPDHPIYDKKIYKLTKKNIMQTVCSDDFHFICEDDLLSVVQPLKKMDHFVLDLSENTIRSLFFLIRLAFSIRQQNKKACILFYSFVFIFLALITVIISVLIFLV